MKYLLFLALYFVAGTMAFAQGLQKGIQLFEDKKYDEASSVFASVDRRSPDYAESLYYLGRISTERNNLPQAQTHLENAVDQAPDRAEYHMALGMVYSQRVMQANPLMQALYAGKIRSTFQKVADLDKSNIQARWILLGFYLRAPKAMGGDISKAKTMANELRQINNAEGSRAWGQIYQVENKPEEAERSYKRAISLAPDSLSNYLMLGNFYQSTEQFDQAFDLYESVLKRFPGNRNILYQIGRTSSISGNNPDRGFSVLRNYIETATDKKSSSLAPAWFHLGQIEEKRGNKAEARKYYQEALNLNPEHKPSKEALEKP